MKKLIYDNPLACEKDVEGFILEGQAQIAFEDGRMQLISTADPELGQAANYVYWCPETFPADVEITWEFQPLTEEIRVHPGASQEILFIAHNTTDRPMTAQAVPSVAPSRAAAYFHKTECFCFTQQVLQPGERIEMPVRFIVDRDLPRDVYHLRLGYTLFDITGDQAGDQVAGR